MNENKNTIMKAAIKNIIVAFIYVLITIILIGIFFSSKISKAISMVNMVTIKSEEEEVKDIKIDLEHNKLDKKPKYGSKFGTIIIDSLDIDLPLYYGDDLATLRYGVGVSFGSYFPGEGGSIVCMGHNTRGFLRRLPEIEKGAKIRISTVYGDYTYTVYDTKIVNQTEIEAVPMQGEKEILMLYTCYPINSIGHATQRFITYSSLD